jgi:hypothetical protein
MFSFQESFADQINTTQLKKLQLQPFEFCLMILSNSAMAFQKVTHLRAANSCQNLFETGANLVPRMFPDLSCLQLKNNSGNMAKEITDGFNEIQAELLKSLLVQKSGNHRLIFLLLLKTSVKFLSLNININKNSSLSDFVKKCSLDPTLYLSHRHLHDLIIDDDVHFKDVQVVLTSMKNLISVMKSDKRPKFEELNKSLRALKYQENYRKFVGIATEAAKGAVNAQ